MLALKKLSHQQNILSSAIKSLTNVPIFRYSFSFFGNVLKSVVGEKNQQVHIPCVHVSIREFLSKSKESSTILNTSTNNADNLLYGLFLSSTMKKRMMKMNKHKLKKR